MNDKDFEELAVGHALHALSPDDEARFDEALAAHPEWKAVADAAAEDAALLAEAAASVAPPESAREALLALIAETPQEGAKSSVSNAPASASHSGALGPTAPAASRVATGPAAEESPAAPRARRWTRTVFALAACLALIVGVGFGASALNNYFNRPPAVVALQEIEGAADAQQVTIELDSGGTATAHWSATQGSAVLVTDGIPSLAEDQTYELWFVRGEAAISAGVFAAEDGRATALLAGEMQAGDVIAVTVEPAGGSPDGKPSTDPVIVIPTA